jgi:hypothetical protein
MEEVKVSVGKSINIHQRIAFVLNVRSLYQLLLHRPNQKNLVTL